MSVLKGYISSLKYNLHTLEAMAFGRKDGLEKVNDLLNPIILHLVKIAVYKTTNKDRTEQIKHWESEIIEWLYQIYEFCDNLKHGKRLKFKDYMLCLDDDLGRESLVRVKMMRCDMTYKGKCFTYKDTDPEALRLKLWAVLEAQFRAMAGGKWVQETLTEHAEYIQLKNGIYAK